MLSSGFICIQRFLACQERLWTSPCFALGSDAQKDNRCQFVSVIKMPKHPDGLVLPSIWVSPKKDAELQRALILLCLGRGQNHSELERLGVEGGSGQI